MTEHERHVVLLPKRTNSTGYVRTQQRLHLGEFVLKKKSIAETMDCAERIKM